MAQKDVSRHPEEKHALHHDGPQRSGGRPQEMRRKIRPWHETSYQKEMACQPPLQGPHAGRRDGSDQHFSVREATFPSTRGTLTRIGYIAHPAEMLARWNLCRVLVRTGIRLQLRRSTRRHDHSPVIAVFLKETEQKKKRENSQRGLQRP